jgi:ferrous iron transport protein A
MTLDNIQENETALIKKISSGRKSFSKFLALGLLPNCRITVLKNNQLGPLLIRIGESTMAIGHGMANKIIVDRLQH